MNIDSVFVEQPMVRFQIISEPNYAVQPAVVGFALMGLTVIGLVWLWIKLRNNIETIDESR